MFKSAKKMAVSEGGKSRENGVLGMFHLTYYHIHKDNYHIDVLRKQMVLKYAVDPIACANRRGLSFHSHMPDSQMFRSSDFARHLPKGVDQIIGKIGGSHLSSVYDFTSFPIHDQKNNRVWAANRDTRFLYFNETAQENNLEGTYQSGSFQIQVTYGHNGRVAGTILLTEASTAENVHSEALLLCSATCDGSQTTIMANDDNSTTHQASLVRDAQAACSTRDRFASRMTWKSVPIAVVPVRCFGVRVKDLENYTRLIYVNTQSTFFDIRKTCSDWYYPPKKQIQNFRRFELTLYVESDGVYQKIPNSNRQTLANLWNDMPWPADPDEEKIVYVEQVYIIMSHTS